MAQLVEQLLPIPEIRGLNPVIGKLLYRTFVYCQLLRKDENEEKEAEDGSLKKFKQRMHLSRVQNLIFSHWN